MQVIVERYIREKTLPLLDKTKFLVPFELTLGQFLCLLRSVCNFSIECHICVDVCNWSPCSRLSCVFSPSRNKIALDSTQALFLLVAEKSMSCMSSSMGEVYSHHRDTDGFLYITYASQEIFGGGPPPC